MKMTSMGNSDEMCSFSSILYINDEQERDQVVMNIDIGVSRAPLNCVDGPDYLNWTLTPWTRFGYMLLYLWSQACFLLL